MTDIGQNILKNFKEYFCTQTKELLLHEPYFAGNEWKYIKDCIDTGWVSSVGKYVDLFERSLAEYTGSPYVVATVNGTSALHIALMLADVKSGMEVLVPSLTFVASANAVSYCNAVPHFVECDRNTLCIDIKLLEKYLEDISDIEYGALVNRKTGRIIKAIMPVHVLGYATDMDALMQLCKRYPLEIIEDASEALGCFYQKRHLGTFGKFGVLSFNGNKVITTGGGGAILISDAFLAKRAKHLTTTAKIEPAWQFRHDEIGYNYRMPNVNASIGLAQMEHIQEILFQKCKLAERYVQCFSNIEEISVLHPPKNLLSNHWLNAIRLKQPNRELLDEIVALFFENKVQVRPLWSPLHQLIMYQENPRMDLGVTVDLHHSVLTFPSSVSLTDLYG